MLMPTGNIAAKVLTATPRGTNLEVREALLPPALSPDDVVARIGLISDTHMPEKCLDFPPAVFNVLRGVDLILHAGDVGELWVLDRLSTVAPVVAVRGNDESAQGQLTLPYQQVITAAGKRIVLCHSHFRDPAEEIAWRSRKPSRGDSLALRAAFGHRAGAEIVVFGHSHVPMGYRYDGVLLINPGAIAPAAPIYRQKIRTLALLYIRGDGAPFTVHVDLANPGEPFEPGWWKDYDWPAGVRGVSDRFTETILDSEFVEDNLRLWLRLQNEGVELRKAYDAALLREAHRCWAGETEHVTRAGVIDQLNSDGEVSPWVRDTLIAWVGTTSSGAAGNEEGR